MADRLDAVVRASGARIVAALAARFRDLTIAEDGFAEACARATERWQDASPTYPEAWLYRVAERAAIDALRRQRSGDMLADQAAAVVETKEESMLDMALLIPDERLRLIFVCCHPSLELDVRAALALQVVCGLNAAAIARSFLVPEATLAQRLVRAKRKIAEAGLPFEVPPPEMWADRLEAVLTTLEIAYAKAHEDAAGAGAHADFADEVLWLTGVLADLLPDERDVLALAALVRFAEARRPARVDGDGVMVPLAFQDPRGWNRAMIDAGDALLKRAIALGGDSVRLVEAAIHACWCRRPSLAEPPPWRKILALYDRRLDLGWTPVVRLNRLVALAEVEGVGAALSAIEALDTQRMRSFLPFQVVRADLLARDGQRDAARQAYDSALLLHAGEAESRWLQKMRDSL